MLATDLRNLHEEGERLHPHMDAVVRRYDSRTDDPVDPSEVSSVLRQLAEDEALMRRGLELAEDLQLAFRAAAFDREVGEAAQLKACADLWAARAFAYVRCGAWTVWRAQRVAHRAELAAAAAEKQESAERSRAERLLAVRAAVERALSERAEAERDAEAGRAEKRLVASHEVRERVELVALHEAQELVATHETHALIETQEVTELVAATHVSQVLVAMEEAKALPADAEELAAAGAAMKVLPTGERLAWAGILLNEAEHGTGGGAPSRWAFKCVWRTRSMAARDTVKQRGRLPRGKHGDRDATMTSGPGPPVCDRRCRLFAPVDRA